MGIILQLDPLAKFLAEVRDYCSHLQEDEKAQSCYHLQEEEWEFLFVGLSSHHIETLRVTYMLEVGSNLGTIIIISTYRNPFTVMT